MEKQKPMCPIIGANGNIFNLLGIAKCSLEEANLKDEASTMVQRVYHANSYDEALRIIMEYVEPCYPGDVEYEGIRFE